MGSTGQILTTPLCLQYTSAHWHQPKIRTSKGLGASDDIGLPRWFVQGGDLGGRFQAFVQHLKCRAVGISVSSSLLSICLWLPSTGATWAAELLSPGSRGEGGAQGAPKKPSPCPHHPSMLSRESCSTQEMENQLGLMFLDGRTHQSNHPKQALHMPSSSPSVNLP